MNEEHKEIREKASILRGRFVVNTDYAKETSKYADQFQEAVKNNPEEADRYLNLLRRASEDVGKYTAAAYSAEQESKEHYHQNADAYHEIAIAEADDDEVQITISQPQEPPVPIEVRHYYGGGGGDEYEQ